MNILEVPGRVMMSPPQAHGLGLILRKISGKLHLREVLQNQVGHP